MSGCGSGSAVLGRQAPPDGPCRQDDHRDRPHGDRQPKAKANAKAKDSGPEFEVLTVNGKTIREPGKPPWAGGPKVVGPSHPGYAGWSKNHGNGNGKVAKPTPQP